MQALKHEWRKQEKALYLPQRKPVVINVPPLNFVTIAGEGNPNSEHFTDYIGALYALTYAIKMTPKKMTTEPDGYYDYTVYPLEGVWDLNEEGRKNYDGTFDKDDLVFKLMIRQPDFVNESFYQEMLALTKKKNSSPLLDQVKLETITEGMCVQMLHLGPYDDEPASFSIMEAFAQEQGLERLSKTHREIYISDPRRSAPEKLKTVLRFRVKE